MKLFALLFVLFTPFTKGASAQETQIRTSNHDWDYQLMFQGRSYTAGAVGQATIGHWFLLWGQSPLPSLPPVGPAEGGSPGWQFGYIRPVVTLQSAGVMNRATVELEFFPISIFGIAVGQGMHQRPNFSQQFDCKQVSCSGWLSRTSLRGQFVVGAAGLFAGFIVRREWVSSENKTKPFTDEGMGVLGNTGQDSLLTATWALGYQLHPKWAVGAQVIRGAALTHPNHSLTSALFVNYFRGSTSYIVGGGSYVSDFVRPGFTMVTMIVFNGIRPIGFL